MQCPTAPFRRCLLFRWRHWLLCTCVCHHECARCSAVWCEVVRRLMSCMYLFADACICVPVARMHLHKICHKPYSCISAYINMSQYAYVWMHMCARPRLWSRGIIAKLRQPQILQWVLPWQRSPFHDRQQASGEILRNRVLWCQRYLKEICMSNLRHFRAAKVKSTQDHSCLSEVSSCGINSDKASCLNSIDGRNFGTWTDAGWRTLCVLYSEKFGFVWICET